MDVVLEFFDTYVFDRAFATFAPIGHAYSVFEPISTLAAGLKQYGAENESWAHAGQTIAGDVAQNGWTWTPASQFVSFPPSQYAYQSSMDRDNIWRQAISLYFLTWFSATAIYFLCATLSYVFVFDKTTFNHPKYLKNQIRMEIRQTLESIPIMTIFTVPFFVAEVRGHGFMYDTISTAPFNHFLFNIFGSAYNWIQFPFFLMFTDFFIYWIHRGLHHPLVYKRLHKPHHKWIMPTPYASHAFHPLDGYSQIMIHDGEYVANSPVINGAACHTMHHLYFNYNYGQFTTLWDRIGGSYRQPNEELFKKESKMAAAEWNRQVVEMEKMVKEVEGKDDRTYGPPDAVAKKVQ
ncbi:hypothetical protein AMS68_003952 [Peltaster fructicola]|uniref:Fatty acid hydroxylase domain-containing protein n=1 Tax=Peltaster fructicola TaxID=286661 RepID=A0A6H0XUV3_9PEZI|nr:hypothetical protein AMS68_003952 [Peltaster fructicola]